MIGKLVRGKSGRGSTEHFGLIRGKEPTREDKQVLTQTKANLPLVDDNECILHGLNSHTYIECYYMNKLNKTIILHNLNIINV